MGINRPDPASGLRRVLDLFRRAVGHAGPDRDTLLLIAKSALAATIAWVLADVVLRAPSATFAPFSALLMVQVTVSRSMDQALRYALAVVAGVVLTGLLLPLLGATIWTFAILMVIALVFGRWRRLGNQGPQVAVAALFAYSAFIQSSGSGNGGSLASVTQLLSIAGLVVLGCTVGVITNLAILPPIRYRAAEYAITGLSQSVCDLLSDLAANLREDTPDPDDADGWRDRARQLRGTVGQSRDSVEHAAETLRYNPRRALMRRTKSFHGYRIIINSLERVVEQLGSITRGLRYAADAENLGPAHEYFLRYYAELLDAAAASTRTLGTLHTSEDVRNSDFDEDVRRGRAAFENLSAESADQRLDAVDQWPTFSALETDGHRLVDEFLEAERSLQELAD